MSYILDALRKSEEERQAAAGQGAGMLHPAALAAPPRPRMALLLVAGLGIAAFVLAWWAGARTPAAITPPAAAKMAIAMPAATAPEPPAPAPAGAPRQAGSGSPAPEARGIGAERAEGARQAPAATLAEVRTKRKSGPPGREAASSAPGSPATGSNAAAGESPNGLPEIRISGYIDGEQGASLAIVNDKLVREGEEVSPGLRLEKIVGESAVFSYKGQRFRR